VEGALQIVECRKISLKMKNLPSVQLSRDQFPWLMAALLYLISYGVTFLYLDAIYWDDWVLFNVEPEIIIDTFKQAGLPFAWAGHLHVGLLKVGPEIYRILTFILMFLSGYLLWLIIGSIAAINQLERNLIALFFLILPLNAARVALINFPSTLCHFSFFLAWYLLVCRTGFISKGLSLLLFLFSFTVNSLLVFYALPIAHAVYLSAGFNLKKTVMWASKSFLFLMAPFVWFYVKTHYFAPYGLYAESHALKLDEALKGLLLGAPLVIIFITWLVKMRQGKSNPVDGGLALLFWGAVITWLAVFPYVAAGRLQSFGGWQSFHDWQSRHQLLMPLGAAVAMVGAHSWISRGNTLRFAALALLVFGVVFTWLAVFPYLAVGRLPSFDDWQSRYRLLMPFASAVAIVGAASWISYGNAVRFALLALAISSLVNLYVALEYHVDWIKQREVLQLISRSDEIKAARTILFDDRAAYFNARGRTYRFYEYNGWFKFVYGDQTRWGMDQGAWEGPLTAQLPDQYKQCISKHYNASEYIRSAPDLIVRIQSTNGRLKTLITGSGGFSLDIKKLPQMPTDLL
jgi:hypothetical protein